MLVLVEAEGNRLSPSRFWRRRESNLAASSDDHNEDLETGIVNAADFPPPETEQGGISTNSGRQTEGMLCGRFLKTSLEGMILRSIESCLTPCPS